MKIWCFGGFNFEEEEEDDIRKNLGFYFDFFGAGWEIELGFCKGLVFGPPIVILFFQFA